MLEAVVLGVVQGVTEFFPVSSSGHLVLGQDLLGIELPGVAFEVSVHLATLCAVGWVYRTRLAELCRGVSRGDRECRSFAGLLAVATVPAALAGLWLDGALASLFESALAAAVFLVLTGFAVWSVRYSARRAGSERPTVFGAVGIGAAQAAAILPGISRSGFTVAAATALGVDARRAADFSFLLSLPAIAGAAVLQLRGAGEAAAAIGAWPLLAGFVAAAASGVVAIRFFLQMVGRGAFHRFAYYCWVVGGVYIIAALTLPQIRG